METENWKTKSLQKKKKVKKENKKKKMHGWLAWYSSLASVHLKVGKRIYPI